MKHFDSDPIAHATKRKRRGKIRPSEVLAIPANITISEETRLAQIMPLTNRRRARRKEIQLQETSDAEAPDSSPSRPSAKKRKVSQHSCWDENIPAQTYANLRILLIYRLIGANLPHEMSQMSPATRPWIRQAITNQPPIKIWSISLYPT